MGLTRLDPERRDRTRDRQTDRQTGERETERETETQGGGKRQNREGGG